jgi:hypothetical protein
LNDKKKFDRLMDDLSEEIEDLTELFPATISQLQKLAKAEPTQIVLPSEIEEPGESLIPRSRK